MVLQNARVVVPRGSLLRSTVCLVYLGASGRVTIRVHLQVTFSDLSGGYDTIRSEYDVPPPLAGTASRNTPISSATAGGFSSVPLRTYEIIDDPNSMAVFAVSLQFGFGVRPCSIQARSPRPILPLHKVGPMRPRS